MANDLIQIVDENDNPVGVATRAEAQQKGLFHRLTRVIVYNEAGGVLLQKRAATVSNWPNRWTNSASGHVDAGEDYETAAKRELSEELGVTGALEKVAVYKTQWNDDGKIFNRFNAVFKITLPSTTQFTLQTEEVSEVRWFTVDEIKALAKDTPDLMTLGAIDTLPYLEYQ